MKINDIGEDNKKIIHYLIDGKCFCNSEIKIKRLVSQKFKNEHPKNFCEKCKIKGDDS